MKPKEKRCRAIGRAAGYTGCGLPSLHRKYGLCIKKCYPKWLYSTPEGREIIQQATRKASKELLKNGRREHREKKAEVKTLGELKGFLQDEVNEIARYIDIDKGCISCQHGHEQPFHRQAHGSHYHNVGSHPSVRFNLHNIHKSCSICNKWNRGNKMQYLKGLEVQYNLIYAAKVTSLPLTYPELKASRSELIQATKKAREIIREIKKGKDFTRDEVNKLIGLYK